MKGFEHGRKQVVGKAKGIGLDSETLFHVVISFCFSWYQLYLSINLWVGVFSISLSVEKPQSKGLTVAFKIESCCVFLDREAI